MGSATTADSRSVVFEYDVKNGDLGQSIDFGIFRSADDRFDATDVEVGSATAMAPGQASVTIDDSGQPATAQGHHRLTVPLPQGLTPNPENPYVLVVADPAHTLKGVTETEDTAAFRKYVIGVVTHGGVQPKSWDRGVPWALRMGESLRAEGYDAVIVYNWASESRHAGSAEKQGPRLARKVLAAASLAPAGEPVDVHFIGHSEGTVVNSLAIRKIARDETPQLQAGFLKDTLLDPHAANNHVPGGKQYSVSSGLLGEIAHLSIDDFQRRAKDPLPVIPSSVDGAEVFYQHTPVSAATGSNDGIYNLWGQVPVPVQGDVPVHYYNLTGVGISHAGSVGVQDWYEAHVVPTLGNGSSFEDPTLLTGGLEGGGNTAQVSNPTFAGNAAPGAQVRVLATRRGESEGIVLGRTAAGTDGRWTLTARSLPAGTYHVVAKAVAEADPAWPHVRVLPRTSLGTVTVDGPRRTG